MQFPSRLARAVVLGTLLVPLFSPLCSLAAPALTYVDEARRLDPAFQPVAARGEAFFRQRFAVSETLPSCTTCHTNDPRQPGRHAVTGKDLQPLAARANPARFSDGAKVEKWMGRNCREVVGRACTAAEKADLVAYLAGGV